MDTGILYNTFICFFIGIISLIVFFLLQENRKERKVEYSEGLDYFSLFLGLLWLFVGLRTLFVWLNLLSLDVLTFQWISGPLTYLHLTPLFFYFGWSFFQGTKWRSLFNGFFSVIILLVVFTFFMSGFEVGEVTYWGTDHTPNPLTNKLFSYFLFAPIFILMIVEFIRRLRNWMRSKDFKERQLLWFTVGFLIYAITGILDALGAVRGWLILLVRIGIMLAPLIFYLSATFGAEKE